ncbi:hypothetical protein M5D96_009106 [Drosophila gunungcola]|uniref:Reverse transcriptase domain-containing protein n=1 Tax=Drosophila gunungcola TaxID=103775 RepID=A0A9P9YJC5_9MUSC|nr:hypothetical protein M5D96_009106 [Drosophila gunungcola]
MISSTNRIESKTVVSNLYSPSDLAKILLNIVRRRLTRWCKQNHILSDCQIRFSGKSSKVDFVYILSTAAKLKLAEKGTKVYSYFVHFKSVLPEMPKKLLWTKLQKLGVSSKIVNYLRLMYKKAHYQDELLNYFRIGGGVLSELMFTLYLNDLAEELKGEPGLVIDNRQISILMFADKVAILSESTRALQDMINRLEKFCIKWGMAVDMEKSEVMVFRRGGQISAAEKWIIRGKQIKTTSKAAFLDFEFTSSLSNRKQVLKMIADAKSRLEDFSTDTEPWIRLMERYMAQIWGSELFKEIDKLQESYERKTRNTTICNSTHLHSLALDLQLKYIGSIYFSRNQNSVAQFLNLKVIENNVLWAQKLSAFCEPFKLKWKRFLNSELEWSNFCSSLLTRLEKP